MEPARDANPKRRGTGSTVLKVHNRLEQTFLKIYFYYTNFHVFLSTTEQDVLLTSEPHLQPLFYLLILFLFTFSVCVWLLSPNTHT